jgi:hypothetical protein
MLMPGNRKVCNGKGDTETQERLQQPDSTRLSLEPQPAIINRQQQADDQGTSKGDTETQEGLRRPNATRSSLEPQLTIADRQQALTDDQSTNADDQSTNADDQSTNADDDQSTNKGDTEMQERLQQPSATPHSSLEPQLATRIVDRQQWAEVSMSRWLEYYNV